MANKVTKVLSKSGVRTFILSVDEKKRFQQDFWTTLESVTQELMREIVTTAPRTTLTGADVLKVLDMKKAAPAGDVPPAA